MNYQVLSNKTEFESKHLKDRMYNYLDTTFEIPDEFSYSLIQVTADYVARPDLISFKAYNDDSYADVICKLNGISNPFEINEGDVLVLPIFSELSKFLVTPNIAELHLDEGITERPTAKKKTEKRKANEAVIGDKRFSIDKNKRIIIY